jgi:hypothetical protein
MNKNYYFTWLDSIPWSMLILGSLTLGLAPFTPPHLFEKLGMLVQGTLSQPIDIFDLLMHAFFPILLLAKGLREGIKRAKQSS